MLFLWSSLPISQKSPGALHLKTWSCGAFVQWHFFHIASAERGCFCGALYQVLKKVLELCTWKHGLFASSKSSHTFGLCWTWISGKHWPSKTSTKLNQKRFKTTNFQLMATRRAPTLFYEVRSLNARCSHTFELQSKSSHTLWASKARAPHFRTRLERELPYFWMSKPRAPPFLAV